MSLLLVLALAGQFSEYEVTVNEAIHLEEMGSFRAAAERYELAGRMAERAGDRAEAFLKAARIRVLREEKELAEIDLYIVARVLPTMTLASDEDPRVLRAFDDVKARIADDRIGAEDRVVDLIRRRRGVDMARDKAAAAEGLGPRDVLSWGLIGGGLCGGLCGGILVTLPLTTSAPSSNDEVAYGCGIASLVTSAVAVGVGVLILSSPDWFAGGPATDREGIRDELRGLTGRDVAMAY